MTAEANSTVTKTDEALIQPEPENEPATQPAIPSGPPPAHSHPRRFPGLVAICAYMILLAGIICYDTVVGQIQPVYLLFSVFFIAGSLGLMMMLRWGWALVLAAVAMMSAFFFWTFSTQHLESALVQGLLNLIFFLYLVRSDLREKMR